MFLLLLAIGFAINQGIEEKPLWRSIAAAVAIQAISIAIGLLYSGRPLSETLPRVQWGFGLAMIIVSAAILVSVQALTRHLHRRRRMH